MMLKISAKLTGVTPYGGAKCNDGIRVSYGRTDVRGASVLHSVSAYAAAAAEVGSLSLGECAQSLTLCRQYPGRRRRGPIVGIAWRRNLR